MWVALTRAACCVVAFGGSEKSRLVSASASARSDVPSLCPAFLRKFVYEPVCCVPLQIQTFYQILVLVAEYRIDC